MHLKEPMLLKVRINQPPLSGGKLQTFKSTSSLQKDTYRSSNPLKYVSLLFYTVPM